jgi:subtilase family serine protease
LPKSLSRRHAFLNLEELEVRALLSGTVPHPITTKPPTVTTPVASATQSKTDHITLVETANGLVPAASEKNDGGPSPVGLNPTQILSYYGINNILFGAIQGNGSGQTIAIVDAYDNPKFVSSSSANFVNSDLHQFDLQYGLPEPTGFFTKLDQTGGTNYPAVDPSGGWETEEALDVEWAHALAPMAKIILIEANSAYDSDLIDTAVNTARGIAAVSVVSMSFGTQDELSEPAGSTEDGIFTTPTGHQPITFLAATGDTGAQGGYPAYSPNVVAVGGTMLNASGATFTETGWGNGETSAADPNTAYGSGGGVSDTYTEPSFQKILTPTTTYGNYRTIPDVSFNAGTGVAVYDSYNNGSPAITDPLSDTAWEAVEGTSFACPSWAALIAIADQGRALYKLPTLNGVTDTLPRLYTLAYDQYDQSGEVVFNDITSGNNGYAAGYGYDLVTGIGSPIANKLIPQLIGAPATHFLVSTSSTTPAGTSLQVTVTALDAEGGLVSDYLGTIHFASSDKLASLPANYTFTGADAGAHVFTVTLYRAGTQTITVNDTKTTTVKGSASVLVTPLAATHFTETGYENGNIFTLTITAVDPYGNLATTFQGTVNFSSSTLAGIPSSYTFSGSDNGVHSFTLNLTPENYGVYYILITSEGMTSLDALVWKLYGHRQLT